MIILAIDPSINEAGWAVICTDEHVAGPPDFPVSKNPCLTEFGVWRPKAKDPYKGLSSMLFEYDKAVDIHCVTDAVIETTSGKVSTRHKGDGSGLSLYGVAVGGFVANAWDYTANRAEHVEPCIHLVKENLWTGRQPKRSTENRIGRHEQTIAEFGLDAKVTDHETDAIALGMWWYDNRKISEKMA